MPGSGGARANVGAAVLGPDNHELLYAVGGSDANNNPVAIVQMYDHVANSWTNELSLTTPRSGPMVAAANGKIYAIGGECAGGVTCASIEEFDGSAWSTKSSVVPTPRKWSGVTVLDNKIYLIGGNVGGTQAETARVDVYDPANDSWAPETDMPTERFSLGAATANNHIYAIGGSVDGIAKVGKPFIYQITATNNPISFSSNPSTLPAGLSFDPALGIIFGTPTDILDTGIEFTASNGNGPGLPKVLRITVQQAPSSGLSPAIGDASSSPPLVSSPEIISSSCATGRTGVPFRFQVLAKDASPSAQFTAGGLPYQQGVGPELSIDPATGVISGTVLSLGALNFPVTLGITDNGATTHSTLLLTFVSDPAVPVITSSDSAYLTPGVFFSYKIKANPPASFSYIGSDGMKHQGVSTQGLPPGLSFDGTDTISGTYNGGNANGSPNGIVRNQSNAAPNFEKRVIWPDTITIRPPRLSAIQLLAGNPDNLALAATRGLDFFQATTFAGWKQNYFTAEQLNDPTISGDSADPDHDGLPNLLEYAFGLDPTTPSTTNRPYSTLDSNYLSLIYTKVLAATDLTYTIEESTDLSNWVTVTPVNEDPVLMDDGFIQTIKASRPRTDAGSAGKLFLRLQVSH
jgi:hypothetical protein